MARTVEQCNDYIVSQLVTTFANAGITIDPTLWSKRNLIRLICYTIAIAQSLMEQLWDVSYAKMQALAAVSASGSVRWLQQKIFEFQYSATNPQYLVVTSGVYSYPTVDESLRIVTACAVSSTISNQVNIKVAKGTTSLSALAAGELTALQGYVTNIGNAGIVYSVTSTDPDRLYIEGTIYYNGLYAAVIQGNVIDAIDAYLVSLSQTRFGGDIQTSDIENLIRNIEGVTDVALERVSCRYESQAVFAGIDLILAGDWINRRYNIGAGYMIQEDTVNYTFSDTLTFVAE